jgi:hypothetical protein
LNKEKISGAIFPVPVEMTQRLFDAETKIFIKCLPRSTTRLTPKNKIIFYASHGLKELVGEGTIEKIEFLNTETILSKYKHLLFLNEDECREYIKGRRDVLTLTLVNLKKYCPPIKYGKNLTMAGQYITNADYRSLTK